MEAWLQLLVRYTERSMGSSGQETMKSKLWLLKETSKHSPLFKHTESLSRKLPKVRCQSLTTEPWLKSPRSCRCHRLEAKALKALLLWCQAPGTDRLKNISSWIWSTMLQGSRETAKLISAASKEVDFLDAKMTWEEMTKELHFLERKWIDFLERGRISWRTCCIRDSLHGAARARAWVELWCLGKKWCHYNTLFLEEARGEDG